MEPERNPKVQEGYKDDKGPYSPHILSEQTLVLTPFSSANKQTLGTFSHLNIVSHDTLLILVLNFSKISF